MFIHTMNRGPISVFALLIAALSRAQEIDPAIRVEEKQVATNAQQKYFLIERVPNTYYCDRVKEGIEWLQKLNPGANAKTSGSVKPPGRRVSPRRHLN
jgi:hypothetical protein